MNAALPSWVGDLIGREWHATRWNCYTLVQEIWRDHLKRDLPDFHNIDPANASDVAAAMHNESDAWKLTEDGGEFGDVAAIKQGRYVCHVGLILIPWVMVHVRQGTPTHISDLRGPEWKHSLAGIYRRCR